MRKNYWTAIYREKDARPLTDDHGLWLSPEWRKGTGLRGIGLWGIGFEEGKESMGMVEVVVSNE